MSIDIRLEISFYDDKKMDPRPINSVDTFFSVDFLNLIRTLNAIQTEIAHTHNK